MLKSSHKSCCSWFSNSNKEKTKNWKKDETVATQMGKSWSIWYSANRTGGRRWRGIQHISENYPRKLWVIAAYLSWYCNTWTTLSKIMIGGCWFFDLISAPRKKKEYEISKEIWNQWNAEQEILLSVNKKNTHNCLNLIC